MFVEPALMKVHSSLYPTRSRYLPYKLNAFHRSSIKPCGSRKKWPRSRLEEPAGMRSTLSFPAIILKTTATSMRGCIQANLFRETRRPLRNHPPRWKILRPRSTLFDIRIFSRPFFSIFVSSMFEFLTLWKRSYNVLSRLLFLHRGETSDSFACRDVSKRG